MLDAIVDLTKARPHMHKSARFTASELVAYQEGYYTGVVYSLRVAEEAIRRWAIGRKDRRAAAREKQRA
jgi:hypothetical protein